MEFELVEQPQTIDIVPPAFPLDPRLAQRHAHLHRTADRRDQAVLIPDQEFGS